MCCITYWRMALTAVAIHFCNDSCGLYARELPPFSTIFVLFFSNRCLVLVLITSASTLWFPSTSLINTLFVCFREAYTNTNCLHIDSSFYFASLLTTFSFDAFHWDLQCNLTEVDYYLIYSRELASNKW